jgi:multidrug efflux system outer membrane protein
MGALVSLALLAPACTVGPNYHPPEIASLKVPDRFQHGNANQKDQTDLRKWWTRFNDPVLTSLIDSALTTNNDLDAASARLRAARAALRATRGGRLPVLGASAGASASQAINGEGGGSDAYQAGLDASWEADLFGGQRRSVEAARATAEAVEADLHAVRISIVAEVALNYIDARNAQSQLAIARRNLGYQDENVQIADWRVQAGLVSALDLEQSRVLRAQTAASIPLLHNSLTAAANRLAILTGESPGAVTPLLAAVLTVPLPPDGIEAGLPAALLQNRPDVIAAERQLAVETARIGVATAELYPALRLSGSLSTSAFSPGGLGASILGGLASSITAPLFQGGQTRARIEGQRATTDAALSAYRQTVLVALEEVENALVFLDSAKRREAVLITAEASARTAVLYARSQYRAGLIDFQSLLESERSLLSSEDNRATARAARATAAVQLYKALGGGWSDADIPPETRP